MSEEKKKDKLGPVSELFFNTLCYSSTVYAECACGKVYFCEEDDWMQEEVGTKTGPTYKCPDGRTAVSVIPKTRFEEYKEKQAKEPDKYIEIDFDEGVRTIEIGNQTYVEDCPCNWPRQYEDFMWINRRWIIKYIQRRLEKNLENAKSDIEEINEIMPENSRRKILRLNET